MPSTAASSPVLISEFSADAEQTLTAAFGKPKNWHTPVIAVDSEGVDLSRVGQLCIVQLATLDGASCFILDLLGKEESDPLVAWLRELLEDDSVEKIIHDCRMDSDALFHHLQIRLENVHDTACWFTVSTGRPNVGLNDTLRFYELPPNADRDNSVYRTNHAFWATRPLTASMLARAGGDLDSLFLLREKQVEKASGSSGADARSRKKSEEFLNVARDAKVHTFVVRGSVGGFIGRGGVNIRSLERQTNTVIYGRGKREENKFMVFYRNEADLAKVLRKAGC
ncbi:unnamed protein product [Amoebophrya sp. A120]|nr:unnamed protein product [Amoebophrya sp. A120]|eukprot:GSA120T00014860001.1